MKSVVRVAIVLTLVLIAQAQTDSTNVQNSQEPTVAASPAVESALNNNTDTATADANTVEPSSDAPTTSPLATIEAQPSDVAISSNETATQSSVQEPIQQPALETPTSSEEPSVEGASNPETGAPPVVVEAVVDADAPPSGETPAPSAEPIAVPDLAAVAGVAPGAAAYIQQQQGVEKALLASQRMMVDAWKEKLRVADEEAKAAEETAKQATMEFEKNSAEVKIKLQQAHEAMKDAQHASQASDYAAERLNKALTSEKSLLSTNAAESGDASASSGDNYVFTGSNEAALKVVEKLKEAQAATAAAHEIRVRNLGLEEAAKKAEAAKMEKINARERLRQLALHTIDKAAALAAQRAREAASRAAVSARDLSHQLRIADKAASDAARAEERKGTDPKEVSAALQNSLAQANVAKSLHDLAAANAHLALFAKRVYDSLAGAAAELHALVEGKPVTALDTVNIPVLPPSSHWDTLTGPGSELNKLQEIVSAAKNIAQQAANNANDIAVATRTDLEGLTSDIAGDNETSLAVGSVHVIKPVTVDIPHVDAQMDLPGLISSAVDRDALNIPSAVQPPAPTPAAPATAQQEAPAAAESATQTAPAQDAASVSAAMDGSANSAPSADAAPVETQATPARFADKNMFNELKQQLRGSRKGQAAMPQQVLSFDIAIEDELPAVMLEIPEQNADILSESNDGTQQALESLKGTLTAITGQQAASSAAAKSDAVAASTSSEDSKPVTVTTMQICISPDAVGDAAAAAVDSASSALESIGVCGSDAATADRKFVRAEVDTTPVVMANPTLARQRAVVGAAAGSRAAIKYAKHHVGQEFIPTLAELGAAAGAKAAITAHGNETAVGEGAAKTQDLQRAAEVGAAAAIAAVEKYLTVAGLEPAAANSNKKEETVTVNATTSATTSSTSEPATPQAQDATVPASGTSETAPSGDVQQTPPQQDMTATPPAVFLELSLVDASTSTSTPASGPASFEQIENRLSARFASLLRDISEVKTDTVLSDTNTGLSAFDNDMATFTEQLQAASRNIDQEQQRLQQKIAANAVSAQEVATAASWGGKYAGPFDDSAVLSAASPSTTPKPAAADQQQQQAADGAATSGDAQPAVDEQRAKDIATRVANDERVKTVMKEAVAEAAKATAGTSTSSTSAATPDTSSAAATASDGAANTDAQVAPPSSPADVTSAQQEQTPPATGSMPAAADASAATTAVRFAAKHATSAQREDPMPVTPTEEAAASSTDAPTPPPTTSETAPVETPASATTPAAAETPAAATSNVNDAASVETPAATSPNVSGGETPAETPVAATPNVGNSETPAAAAVTPTTHPAGAAPETSSVSSAATAETSTAASTSTAPTATAPVVATNAATTDNTAAASSNPTSSAPTTAPATTPTDPTTANTTATEPAAAATTTAASSDAANSSSAVPGLTLQVNTPNKEHTRVQLQGSDVSADVLVVPGEQGHAVDLSIVHANDNDAADGNVLVQHSGKGVVMVQHRNTAEANAVVTQTQVEVAYGSEEQQQQPQKHNMQQTAEVLEVVSPEQVVTDANAHYDAINSLLDDTLSRLDARLTSSQKAHTHLRH